MSKTKPLNKDIIKFSLGEESFDGVWFGVKHPTEQGAFWWRKYLRQFIKENQPLHVVGRSEQCSACDSSTGEMETALLLLIKNISK